MNSVHPLTLAALLACLAASLSPGLCAAQSLPEARAIIAENLLYPRDARYTLRAMLPAGDVDADKNAEWASVAERLAKAGLIGQRREAGKTALETLEHSRDVIVPSTNLRYETTALNVVLGRWEIEAVALTRAGDVTVVHGKRRMAARTRAYDAVVAALSAKESARYRDRDVTWEISGRGAATQVVEKLE